MKVILETQSRTDNPETHATLGTTHSRKKLFLFNLIVKTIQKYFARPYNP
jgi:hypothetical protein